MDSSRKRPIIPMRRNFEDSHSHQVLPFYLVCEESEEMGRIGGDTAINQALSDLHASIASDPVISERCQFGLITFSDSARELMTLTPLQLVSRMPSISPSGDAKFGPVLNMLKEVLKRDVLNLHAKRLEVFRPIVLLIMATEPTDKAEWLHHRFDSEFSEIGDIRPNILAFGVHQVSEEVLSALGNMGWMHGQSGAAPVEFIAEYVRSFLQSILPSH